MPHDHHSHQHHHGSKGNASKNIGLALLINASFTVIEVIGGMLTGSIAILSDALHDLGDTASLGLAYYLEKHSNRGSNKTFSYGYRRLSLMSALITASILVAGSVIVLWQASLRLMNPTTPHAIGMFWLAILGVAVNGFAAFRVWNGETLNERVISWHMIEDVFGWISVLIVSVIMMFWDAPILDPLLSIVFTCFILFGVYRTLRQTVQVFLQAVPANVNIEELTLLISKTPLVINVHDLHVWSLDGESHVLTVHVVIRSDATIDVAESIKEQIRKVVSGRYAKIHSTIEIESDNIDCPKINCVKNV